MWINESNRDKHFIYGSVLFLILFTVNTTMIGSMLIAAITSFEAVLGVAMALEFKDSCYHNKFDWLDILATILTALVVVVIRLFMYLNHIY